jgi:spore germination protein YaaH
MNIHKRLEQNFDGTYNLVITLDLENENSEFSKAFFEKSKKKLKEIKLNHIKIIVATTLTITIPFSQVFAEKVRYVMSYVYFGTYEQQIEYISISEDIVSVVSPSYFNIDASGALVQNFISDDYINTVHERGIKVVPFLSNHWDREAGQIALNNLDAITDEIALVISERNLDGINVDIEDVTEKERDKYTELVRLLRTKIPIEKEVSVAVAANPYGWTDGWHGSYDYKELGQIADHILVMAYDEHYLGGSSGPVSSISFVENSIKYALKYVDKEKIVVGMPFFGRIWKKDGTIKGIGMSNIKIAEIVSKYNAKVQYDPIARSPKAEFTLNVDTVIGGQELTKGNYIVWYENSDSIKDKLSLISKYDLKGAGNWSSGQETKDVWDYYNLWLNGKYFSDVYNHFAKDDIMEVAKSRYMIGTSDTEFSPTQNLTRAQAAAVLSRVLGLSETPVSDEFSDISKHWAEKEINQIAAKGIIEGFEDGTFKPDKEVTREEMTIMLYRLLKLENSNGETRNFSDVNSQKWSYNEITALAGIGIINGYQDNTFRPENKLSRGEMATLIERVLDYGVSD